MHYPDSRWRPRCQGKSRDDVSGRILIMTTFIMDPMYATKRKNNNRHVLQLFL